MNPRLGSLIPVPTQFADRTSKANKIVSASKEIILAAGAVHSPQILQLSGIGPKKLLKGLNIDTFVDLPGVGYNFHDQPSMFLSFNCNIFPPENLSSVRYLCHVRHQL